MVEEARGGAGLGFQRVVEPKGGRIAFTLNISGPDIGDVKRRVEALGGHRIDGYEDGGFLVMADPEGNEFCVVPTGTIDFDEEGRTRFGDRGRPPTCIDDSDELHDRSEDCPARRVRRRPVLRREPNYESR